MQVNMGFVFYFGENRKSIKGVSDLNSILYSLSDLLPLLKKQQANSSVLTP